MSISEVLILVTPGLCGSVVAIFYDEALTLKRAVLLVFVGMCFSIFITPAVVEYFTLTEKLALAANFAIARYSDTVMKFATQNLPVVLSTYLDKIQSKKSKKDDNV